MSEEDAEGFTGPIVMVGNTIVSNTAALALAMVGARKLYSGYPSPPTPNITSFPCELIVTERHNISTGERIGRIQVTAPDGQVLSDEQWSIAPAR